MNKEPGNKKNVSFLFLIDLVVDVEDFFYFLHGVKGSHLLRGMRVEKALKHEAVERI